jgi:thiosulfate/3-mercaptopyruvate sulfurtransferase
VVNDGAGLMGPLVSADWLLAAAGGITVLDASYYLPNESKDARAIFMDGHIPGARFVDIDAISEQASALPDMLPAPAAFASAVGGMGISNHSRVVVYDQRGIFSAARLWWMFRVFGHDDVAVLDGGLPAWVASGGALEAGAPALVTPVSFTAAYRADMVRSLADMLTNLATNKALVVDARAAGRFDGTVPEPRAGMRSGHIPGARSLPFSAVLENGRMLPPEKLRARFAAAGVDGGKPVVASCGSGVTAAVLSLAMVVAGLPEAAIYDGSWSEWGSRDNTPIEV